jgi:putative addiction module killer protein
LQPASWFDKLRDVRGRTGIAACIASAKVGNFADYKVLGAGISDLPIDVGSGYGVHYIQKRANVCLLVAGGDKFTQSRDIGKAKKLWQMINEEGQ